MRDCPLVRLPSVGRLVHTLRWLPPYQLAALARQRARRAFEEPERFAARRPPADPGVRWNAAPLPAPDGRHDPDRLRAGRFAFLHRTEDLGWPPRWDDDSLPRLWLYNLHYFEFLESLPYESGRALILDWIARHPLARGRVGWEPYPISLRLLSWCGWLFATHRSRVEQDPELLALAWPSIWLQAEWLARHIETHLRGNHLLENAAALAYCGACFAGPGDRWLPLGLAWLERELPEQILPDGVHFERSPMYHARAVQVLAQLVATGVPDLVACVADPLARAKVALAKLCHPDGEIALLNDAAFGIARHPGDLLDQPARDGAYALRDAGYYGARAAGHYIVCDAAPIGPDYQPGHAHGDLLSFELSLAGQRVIVDAGVHGYDGDPLRAWCRSTRAHNTVEIDGQDQCEFWSTFRVARRGRPRDVAWTARPGGFSLSAWHDGYDRLRGQPRHAREFRWYDDGVLLVRDRVTSSRPALAVSRLHLHPDCAIEEISGLLARIRHPGGRFAVAFAGAGRLAEEASTYCPEFGRSLDARALAFTPSERATEFGFCIAHTGDDVRFALAPGAEVNGRSFPW
jgi:uncharacterized heparinase superfamily protein